MPSIQIKHVPADVHRTLRKRAAERGQSLQAYLHEQLTLQARTPTLDEVLGKAGERSGGHVSLADSAAVLWREREER